MVIFNIFDKQLIFKKASTIEIQCNDYVIEPYHKNIAEILLEYTL